MQKREVWKWGEKKTNKKQRWVVLIVCNKIILGVGILGRVLLVYKEFISNSR